LSEGVAEPEGDPADVVETVAVAEPAASVRVETAVPTRLVTSEPMELASEAAADPRDEASLLTDERAPAPAVLAASAREVALEAMSDPMDWPPPTAVE
jgi:hypothetical protein